MGSLTVHVLDDDGDPIVGEKVFVNFVGSFLGIVDTNLEEYTDDDGAAEFQDIPVGPAEIYVNGELQESLSIGQNDHKDITVTL